MDISQTSVSTPTPTPTPAPVPTLNGGKSKNLLFIAGIVAVVLLVIGAAYVFLSNKPAEKIYFCPCHTSEFKLDGTKQNDIPPRHLDTLEIQIRNGGEVWLKFQNFRATTPEKIPVG